MEGCSGFGCQGTPNSADFHYTYMYISGLLCSGVLVHVVRAALQLLVQPLMPCKARVRVTQRQSINQSIIYIYIYIYIYHSSFHFLFHYSQ